jgi:hypothetical protein
MEEASPRFRQDLVAATTEADGVPCVDVSDPATGNNFRFYDFEYQLAQQLNGQPLRAVTEWASAAYGVDLTADGIREFAGRLAELGFLEPAAQPDAAETPPPDSGAHASDNLDNAEAEWMTTEGAQTATYIPDPTMLENSPGEPTPVAPLLPGLDIDDDEGVGAETNGAGRGQATPPPVTASQAPRLFDIPVPRAADKVPTREIPLPVVPPAARSPGFPPPPVAAPLAPPVAAPPAAASLAPPILGSPAAAPPATKPAAPSWATELDDKLMGGAAAPTPPPAAHTSGEQPTPPPLGMPAPTPTLPTAPPSPARATGAQPTPVGLPERRQPPSPDAVQMTGFADEATAAARRPPARQTRTLIWIVLALAAAGIGYLAWSRMQARTPEAVSVHVLSPRPAAIYKWFSAHGTVTDYETRTLSFPSAGTLAEALPPGSTFAAGEILGKLRGAAPLEGVLTRARARAFFYQQMRESMRAAGNQIELRQAEIKLADKQRLVDEAAAALAKITVRASEPGEVVETMAKVGGYVRAGAPLVRAKGRALHGEFALDQDDAAIARDLAFCRVEVVGLGPRASNAEARGGSDVAADLGSPEAQIGPRFIDCTVAKDGGRDKLRVVLPNNVGLVPGQPLRLARQRFDAVFPIPAALVTDAAGEKTVWVASRAGRAERRAVTLAEAGDEALVSGGLQVGDELITDAPADLRPGAAIAVRR